MPNRGTDELFQLIKSALEQGEKGNSSYLPNAQREATDSKPSVCLTRWTGWKSMMNRGYSEIPGYQKKQLSQYKASLYRQLLATETNKRWDQYWPADQRARWDITQVLYNKDITTGVEDPWKGETYFQGLLPIYTSCRPSSLKKDQTLHITQCENRAEQLASEVEASDHILLIEKLSNLSLKLYGLVYQGWDMQGTKRCTSR